MKVNNFKDKKVLVMGLGLNGGGVGVARFFAGQGARVLVTDLKTEDQLKESIEKLKDFSIEFVLGEHREEDFASADLVIKNPGVPNDSTYLNISRENRVPVKTDINIFFDLCEAKIIGITGTKGKSTTATLIYLFLKEKYLNVFLAGNIGVSPLEILSKTDKESIVVLELSSFELEDMDKSPHVAVVTNLFEDHLNRYGSFKDYIEAKKNIFKYQGKGDFLVLNDDSGESRKIASEAISRVYFFKKELVKTNLKGDHNLENISAAKTVAEIMGVDKEAVRRVLKSFSGIPNRQEFVAEKRGVKYFNDTTATNPGAAINAIKTFKEEFPDSSLIFIIGGEDKGMDYGQLSEEIKQGIDKLVLLPGSGSEKLKKELQGFEANEVKSMEEAVLKAASLAKEGDIVVLSPAAASFNLFNNEFDRGRKFIKCVGEL